MSADAAGMHFNDGFTDYEAETKSFVFRIGLFKRVKDSFYELWFDADAIVANLDRNPSDSDCKTAQKSCRSPQ